MKKMNVLLWVIAMFLLTGCSNSGTNLITHLPFQTEKDGRWGLIDWEGNILIEDEFKHRPSTVINGMFCVKNSNDLYEFYTAEKKPKQIGEEYLYVGYFSEGLAPVVKKDSRITYINKNGEVVIELTKYKDDPIKEAYPFENGTARVKTASGKYGYINTKGEFVIPATYSHLENVGNNIFRIKNSQNRWGYINNKGEIVINPKYSYGYGFNDNGYAMVEMDNKQIIINRKGEEILKLKDGMQIREWADENLMPYSHDDKTYGYINLKGEKVIKLSSNIEEPTSFYNGYAIFQNSDRDYGTIDKKGEVVIRAKYDALSMCDGFDFMLFKEDNEYGLLSYSGDVIKRASFKDIIPFFKGNKYTYAKDGDEWILIDQKGEDTRKVDVETLFYDNYEYGYCYSVESDYLDIDAEVKSIMSVLNEDGTIDKMTFNMTPGEFATTYNKEYQVSDLKGKDYVNTTISSLKYAEREIGIRYEGEVIKANYKQEWVSSRWGGYYDNVIDGYSYNGIINQKEMRYFISLKGKLLERKKEILEAVWKYLENNNYKKINRWKSEGNNFETTNYEKYYHTLQIWVDNDGVLRIWTWKK